MSEPSEPKKTNWGDFFTGGLVALIVAFGIHGIIWSFNAYVSELVREYARDYRSSWVSELGVGTNVTGGSLTVYDSSTFYQPPYSYSFKKGECKNINASTTCTPGTGK